MNKERYEGLSDEHRTIIDEQSARSSRLAQPTVNAARFLH
jgi:hypothetical protein